MVSIKQILGGVIGIVVSVMCIPTIQSGITAANLTGTLAIVATLIPLVFVFGIVNLSVNAFM